MPAAAHIETEASPGKLPGVSVSQAFGLPDDWTLANSLKGVAGEGDKRDLAVQPEKPDDAPDPDAMEKQKQQEKDAAAAKEKEGDVDDDTTVDEDKKEADRIAAEKKTKDEAAAAKKTADAKAKPAAAAKPADQGTGAKPAAKPDAKPAAPAAPAKVKVGDKEYTPEELAEIIKKANAPAAAPAKPAEPKKEPTPEEKAKADADAKKQEQDWITNTAKNLDTPLDEKTLDTILMGGKEAVAALQEIRRRDMAVTLLSARRDIFEQMKPVIDAVQRMSQSTAQAEEQRMESELVSAHPYLQPHMDLVRQHASILANEHPELVAKMSEKEFNAEVARLTTEFIQKYNPEFGKTPAQPDATATPAAKPGASAPAGGAKPPQKRVTPAAPAGHVPGGAAAAGGKGGDRDFQKSAVASLM